MTSVGKFLAMSRPVWLPRFGAIRTNGAKPTQKCPQLARLLSRPPKIRSPHPSPIAERGVQLAIRGSPSGGRKSRAKALIVSLPHDKPLQENAKRIGSWLRDEVPCAYLIENPPQTAPKLAGLLSCPLICALIFKFSPFPSLLDRKHSDAVRR